MQICLTSHFYCTCTVARMQVAHGVIVVVVALAYSFISSHINDDAASAMDASLAHVAAGVQPLMEANRSAAVVAHSLEIDPPRQRNMPTVNLPHNLLNIDRKTEPHCPACH